MSGLEGFAQGMQIVFVGMLFVLGAVLYAVVVCSLVDAERREKWLLPIPLAFGLAVLLILPSLLGWVGWVLYAACVGVWVALILWQHPALREAVWEALIWLWEAMPHRVAARKAQEEAERQAEAAEKLRRKQEAEAREREDAERRRRNEEAEELQRQREAKRQAEYEASGQAERDRQAAAEASQRAYAAHLLKVAAENEAKAKEEAARKAEAEAKAKEEAEARAKAEAKVKAEAEENYKGFPMF